MRYTWWFHVFFCSEGAVGGPAAGLGHGEEGAKSPGRKPRDHQGAGAEDRGSFLWRKDTGDDKVLYENWLFHYIYIYIYLQSTVEPVIFIYIYTYGTHYKLLGFLILHGISVGCSNWKDLVG